MVQTNQNSIFPCAHILLVPLSFINHTGLLWWEDSMERMRSQQFQSFVWAVFFGYLSGIQGQVGVDCWQTKSGAKPLQNGAQSDGSPSNMMTIPDFFSPHNLSSTLIHVLSPPESLTTTTALSMYLIKTKPSPTVATAEHWQREAVSDCNVL